MIFRHKTFSFPDRNLLFDQLPGNLYVTRNEYAESKFKIIEHATVKVLQFDGAIVREFETILDLLCSQLHPNSCR